MVNFYLIFFVLKLKSMNPIFSQFLFALPISVIVFFELKKDSFFCIIFSFLINHVWVFKKEKGSLYDSP